MPRRRGRVRTSSSSILAPSRRRPTPGPQGDPQARPRAAGGRDRRHRLRRAGGNGCLFGDAGSGAHRRQRRQDQGRDPGCPPRMSDRVLEIDDIMPRGKPHRRGSPRSPAMTAPSCRCRTAATIAAPSASSPSAGGIPAPSRWMTRSIRFAASSTMAGAKSCSPGSTSPPTAGICRRHPAWDGWSRRSSATCRISRACACPPSIPSRPTRLSGRRLPARTG